MPSVRTVVFSIPRWTIRAACLGGPKGHSGGPTSLVETWRRLATCNTMQKRRKEFPDASRLRLGEGTLAEEGSYLATHRSPCCGGPLGRNDASREPSGKCNWAQALIGAK